MVRRNLLEVDVAKTIRKRIDETRAEKDRQTFGFSEAFTVQFF